MPEQSHRAEMSEAIRAQRERAGVPREVTRSTEAAEPAAPPVAQPPRPERPGLIARLFLRR